MDETEIRNCEDAILVVESVLCDIKTEIEDYQFFISKELIKGRIQIIKQNIDIIESILEKKEG